MECRFAPGATLRRCHHQRNALSIDPARILHCDTSAGFGAPTPSNAATAPPWAEIASGHRAGARPAHRTAADTSLRRPRTPATLDLPSGASEYQPDGPSPPALA